MWNWRYERCVSCDTTARRHMAKGKCSYCYLVDYRTEHAAKISRLKESWRKRNWRHVQEQLKLTREEKHFAGKRGAVLERDGYRCTQCGSKKQLVVHHKDGNGRGSKQLNNSMRNLKTFCRACHAREHNLLNRWARNFDFCQKCGTTERTHNAKGLCWRCYYIVLQE